MEDEFEIRHNKRERYVRKAHISTNKYVEPIMKSRNISPQAQTAVIIKPPQQIEFT